MTLLVKDLRKLVDIFRGKEQTLKKVAMVVGTRPEIIKMSPLIKQYQHLGIEFILIHSNQHYSSNMDAIFFESLSLPAPHYHLEVGSASHAIQTARIMERIEPILVQESIDLVYVQGDTNTVMAAALAASKLQIKIAHIEAGLRSFDRSMPEEINRIVTDNIADYLFAVSSVQRDILLAEGIGAEKIFVVGNTIVDALYYGRKLLLEKNIYPPYPEKKYFLLTAHRPSNVDQKSGMEELIDLLQWVIDKYHFPVIWPIHPRAQQNLVRWQLSLPSEVKVIDPTDYLNFLALMSNAFMILTDSGGIQEEACILQVPCLTLRENTERPESLQVGANFLVGRNKTKLMQACKHFEENTHQWDNPFGDGKCAERILDTIHRK